MNSLDLGVKEVAGVQQVQFTSCQCGRDGADAGPPLEAEGVLNRDLESLPSSRQVRRRLERGEALTVPELCVLLSWTKIVLANELIDTEIKGLVEGAHKRATDILKTHEDQLHLLAQALLEYETLTGEEINQLMETGKIDRPDRPSGPAAPTPIKGSAIPKAGKRFSGGDAAAQGA